MAYISNNPKFTSEILSDIGQSSIDAPASGHRVINRGGTLFLQNSSGDETAVGAGTGELNLIADTSSASNWVASGAGITVATTTTASEIPLDPFSTTAIKITPASGTDYVRYRFTMPEALKNTKLKLSWYQLPLSSYASNDLQVLMFTDTQSDYAGTSAEILFDSADSSEDTYIASITGKALYTLDSDDSDYYELRIQRVSGTSPLSIEQVIVGPGVSVSGAVVGPVVDFTPTGSWTANTTYTGNYRRIGSNALIHVTVETTGAPTSATLTVNMPSGLTIDTTALTNSGSFSAGDTLLTSDGRLFDAGTGEYNAKAVYSSSSAVLIRYYNSSAAPTNVTQAQPMTWANGDYAQISFMVPIAEWAGSGTVNLSQNDVEYSSNSSTSDANDTTSFIYGPSGSLTPGALTATRKKRVRFTSPIQSTDMLTLEVQRSLTSPWVPVETNTEADGLGPFQLQNGVSFGMGISGVFVNNTDIDVSFGRYYFASGATYGAAGGAWSALTTTRWRLKKTKAGVAVGFGLAANGTSGLIPYYNTGTDTADNDFSGGTIRYTRIGDVVTLSCGVLTHSSGSVVSTSASFLPTWATPTATVRNVYSIFQDSVGINIEVTSTGQVVMRYYSANGTVSNQTSSLRPGSISYHI